jgi:hypothetical protein
VADSQNTMRESNLDSLENLKTNLRLNRLDPDKVALVFQYNKRDLPNVDTVEDMNAYMNPGNVPVVEASAISGVGVTATLRAAVARILDNLKNNVDTTLHEEPPLTAPDMTQRAGVTTSSAGTPKLSMSGGGQAIPPVREPGQAGLPDLHSPVTEQAPFGGALEPAFDAALETAFENPFAAPAAEIHDPGAERAELEELLANARAMVASLETALERARENERVIAARLAR